MAARRAKILDRRESPRSVRVVKHAVTFEKSRFESCRNDLSSSKGSRSQSWARDVQQDVQTAGCYDEVRGKADSFEVERRPQLSRRDRRSTRIQKVSRTIAFGNCLRLAKLCGVWRGIPARLQLLMSGTGPFSLCDCFCHGSGQVGQPTSRRCGNQGQQLAASFGRMHPGWLTHQLTNTTWQKVTR